MRRLTALLVLSLMAVVPATVRAQSATVTMGASSLHVQVGETFVLHVRAQARGAPIGDVNLPDLTGFQVLSQQVSRPFSFSFGLGSQGTVVQSSIEYILQLQALAPGPHRIDPARVEVGGRSVSSNGLTITVTGSANAAPGAAGGPTADLSSPQGAPEVDGARFDPQAFLRTVVDKQKPYVGEQVTVSVYLYVRGGLRSAPNITQEPTTDGFWIHDLLPATRTLEATQQIVRGVPFRVYELRRFAAFPLKAGDLTIGPMTLHLEMGSLFDLLQGSQPLGRQGVPVVVHAQPLPAPEPDDVVVGSYQIQAGLDRSNMTTGDAATLKVTVQGTGNLKDVQLTVPPIVGLRVLSPQIEDDIQAPNDRVGGTRTFQFLVVPEKPGTYTIPPIGFHAFDPDAKAYRQVRTAPVTLVAVGQPIAAGDEDSTGRGASPPGPGDQVPRFGPIRVQAELRRASTPLSSQPWYPAALATPPFAWLAVLGAGRARRRWRTRSLSQADLRSVHKRLKEARAHAKAGDARAFYGAVAQSLGRAMAVRLGEPVGGFTHQELRRYLGERGMDADLAERLVDELEGCDYARFSASGVTQPEMEHCLARVGALLARIEKFHPQAEEVAS